MTCDKRIRLKNPRDHRKDKKLYKNHAVLSMLISLGKAEKRFFTTFFMGKCNDPSKKYRRFLPLFGQFSLLPLTALPPIVLPSSLVFRTRPSPPPSNSTPVKKLSQKSSGFIEKILPWRFEVSPTLWWSIIPRVKEEQGGANWKITGSQPTDGPTYKVPYAAKRRAFLNWIVFCGKRPHVSKNSKSTPLGIGYKGQRSLSPLCFAFLQGEKEEHKRKKEKSPDAEIFSFCFWRCIWWFCCFRLLFSHISPPPPFQKKKHAATGPSHAHFFIYFQKSFFFSYPGFRCMCVCCTHASHSPTRVKVNNPSIFLDEKPSGFFLKHLTALMVDRSFSLLVLHTRFKCLCVSTGNQV